MKQMDGPDIRVATYGRTPADVQPVRGNRFAVTIPPGQAAAIVTSEEYLYCQPRPEFQVVVVRVQ
jgi:hypothetical protein